MVWRLYHPQSGWNQTYQWPQTAASRGVVEFATRSISIQNSLGRSSVQSLPIHKLEFLAVLVGARIWGHKFKGLKIRMYCDNQPVVDVINSSKTKDAFMASYLRELWLVVSSNEFELRAVHLPGEENRVADWLSRWHLGSKYKDAFNSFVAGSSYEEIHLCDDLFKFSGFI